MRGHSSGDGYEVFDLQEEFELGPRGRRFLLSVDADHGEACCLLAATVIMRMRAAEPDG